MRNKKREITDPKELMDIIDRAKVIRLGLRDEEDVYIVPLNYGYTYEKDTLTFYMHGATEGYKYELMKKNPKVGFELECDVEPFEGKIPCQYGMVFSSIMGKGVISMIEEPADKIEAMKILMKTQTGKDFDFTEKLVTILNVFKLTVTSFTGKHRPNPAEIRAKSLE